MLLLPVFLSRTRVNHLQNQKTSLVHVNAQDVSLGFFRINYLVSPLTLRIPTYQDLRHQLLLKHFIQTSLGFCRCLLSLSGSIALIALQALPTQPKYFLYLLSNAQSNVRPIFFRLQLHQHHHFLYLNVHY